MRTVNLLALLLLRSVIAQECLIDGKNMYSIGSSEIVNGELLALFRCDDGHQMWLTNYDEENAQKDNVDETVDLVQPNPTLSSSSVSLLASALDPESTTLIKKDEDLPIPFTKKESMLKKGITSTNYISKINIKKFGVETLLHKKIESDRVFAEAIEEEKNELLYIMNTQKKLFEMTEESKFKFSLFDNPIKFSIYTALSLILISSL